MRASRENASARVGANSAANKKEKNCVPTLSANHFLWWSRTYGAKCHLAPAAPSSSSKAPDAALLPIAQVIQRLYEAIRDNRRDTVEALVQHRPHVLFAKIFVSSSVAPSEGLNPNAPPHLTLTCCRCCFELAWWWGEQGDGKRTALYVTSFFSRHELVKFFLDRGADKYSLMAIRNLRCEGFRPVDVAGFGRYHAIDHMKVQFLLGEEACPRVIICTEDPASIHTSWATLASPSTVRLQIHFSEPVEDFISDDIVASPQCHVRSFVMLRRDFYIVDVGVKPRAPSLQAELLNSSDISNSSSDNAASATADSSSMFIEVPAGVARRARSRSQSETLNARSNRFVLRLGSPPPPRVPA